MLYEYEVVHADAGAKGKNTDLMKKFGAKRVLAKTHGSIAAALDVLFERVPVAMAQRGDALVFDGPQGQTAAVMWAGQVWAMTEHGARQIPDAVPLFAWRVE